MKKSELLESYSRKLDSLKKEFEYNQKNFKMIDINNPIFRESMILLSEKINTLGNTILDIERIYSLD